MKLLLTSNGIANKSIEHALLSLIDKKPEEIKVVIVPTAANVVPRRKNWLIDDMFRISEIFPNVDIVDFSAINLKDWKPRLAEAEILIFGGGNPFYLKYCMEKFGLEGLLNEWVQSKVLVGISAGSMVMGQNIAFEPKAESMEYLLNREQTGLGFVDFNFLPHLDEEDSGVTERTAQKQASKFLKTLYAIDDNTAIKIDEDTFEIVTEGHWKEFK